MQDIIVDEHITEYGICHLDFLNDLNLELLDSKTPVNLKISDVRFKNFNLGFHGYNLNSCTQLTGLNLKMDIDNTYIHDTINLVELDILKNTRNISGDVSIQNNADLESINGFDSVNNVYYIDIRNNPMLQNVTAFKKLNNVNGNITFKNNGIKTLNAFGKVSYAESIEISKNKNLNVVEGFNSLETLYSDLCIVYNDSLESIRGFNNLTQVYSIILSYNENLKEVIGFDMLHTIPSELNTLKLPDNGKFVLMSFPNICKYTNCSLKFGDGNIDRVFHNLTILNESTEMFEQFKKTFDVKIHGKEVVKQIVNNYMGSSLSNKVLHHIIDSGGYDLLPWDVLNSKDYNTIKKNNKILKKALIS